MTYKLSSFIDNEELRVFNKSKDLIHGKEKDLTQGDESQLSKEVKSDSHNKKLLGE